MTTTAVAVKMGKIDFYSLLRGKNASLGNSILNHSGHITKILIDFSEILLVKGIIEIWKSILASNSNWFKVSGIFKKWQFDADMGGGGGGGQILHFYR